MENNLQNTYLFKALEAYPYELEKAVEALNYALSYNPKCVKALCLMAKVQIEQLGNYELAKEYYELALIEDIENHEIYPDYIRLLVNHGEYEKAEKLIDFALNFKGTKKANILLVQANLFEALEKYEKAKDVLQEAKTIALNNEFIDFVDNVISRVEKKLYAKNKRKKTEETVTKNDIEESKKSWFQNRLNNLL